MARTQFVRQLFGMAEVADRWGMSARSIKRAVERGDLKTVHIGGRRLIPLVEVERAEQYGIGTPRKLRQQIAAELATEAR